MRRAAVLSVLLTSVAAVACGGPARATAPTAYTAHVGDDWFTFRAEQLGIDEAAARARDAALPEDEPPELDAAVTVEAAALWTEQCARCHGEDGQGVDEPALDPAPRRWGGFGVRMGFFFGGDGMRAGIYQKIRDGGTGTDDKPSAMPAWGGTLSREQMWGLVRHIESL